MYGFLYYWEDVCEVCPEGWHLSTEEDWTVLKVALGLDISLVDDKHYMERAKLGDKLKKPSAWKDQKNLDSGWDAVPACYYITWALQISNRKCYYPQSRSYAHFWVDNNKQPMVLYILGNDSNIYEDRMPEEGGYSIRCVKDKTL